MIRLLMPSKNSFAKADQHLGSKRLEWRVSPLAPPYNEAVKES